MKMLALIEGFRARLLLLLALMLGLTLGVQYYFNLRAVRSNAHMIIDQEQAIMTGVALGIRSLYSNEYLDNTLGNLREPLLNDQTGRVKNILLVDDLGNVLDSVIPDYITKELDDKTNKYVQIRDVPLPPLRSAVPLADDNEQLPSWMPPARNVGFGEAGAFYFRVETDKGPRFIIVVLGSA